MQIPIKKHNQEIFSQNKIPTLLYAGHICDEPNWSFNAHSHNNFCEIIYISEGEGLYTIDNKNYTASKGDILIYNSGIIHEEKSNPDNPLVTYFCAVDNLFLLNLPENHLVPSHLSPVINASEYAHKIESYITDIFMECRLQVKGYELICQNLIVSLIILINRIIDIDKFENVKFDKDSVAYKIKDYIDNNYSQNMSLKNIADTLYISQDYISHVFKDEIGTSPINYMITRRIGEARLLLLNTDMSLQKISYKIGYENPNHFSLLFKKITGVSPSKYRKQGGKL